MCSDYNGLIGPGVHVVATEFYKFWVKMNTARPYWVQLRPQTNLKINSSDCGHQNHFSLSILFGLIDSVTSFQDRLPALKQ